MTTREIMAGMLEELPVPEPVEPALLGDEVLPYSLALVEPAAFALACVQSVWGPRGPRN